MTVERTDTEVIIRLHANINYEVIQKTIDLISLREATANSIATQEDIDVLVKDIKKGWWKKNRSLYIK